MPQRLTKFFLTRGLRGAPSWHGLRAFAFASIESLWRPDEAQAGFIACLGFVVSAFPCLFHVYPPPQPIFSFYLAALERRAWCTGFFVCLFHVGRCGFCCNCLTSLKNLSFDAACDACAFPVLLVCFVLEVCLLFRAVCAFQGQLGPMRRGQPRFLDRLCVTSLWFLFRFECGRRGCAARMCGEDVAWDVSDVVGFCSWMSCPAFEAVGRRGALEGSAFASLAEERMDMTGCVVSAFPCCWVAWEAFVGATASKASGGEKRGCGSVVSAFPCFWAA